MVEHLNSEFPYDYGEWPTAHERVLAREGGVVFLKPTLRSPENSLLSICCQLLVLYLLIFRLGDRGLEETHRPAFPVEGFVCVTPRLLLLRESVILISDLNACSTPHGNLYCFWLAFQNLRRKTTGQLSFFQNDSVKQSVYGKLHMVMHHGVICAMIIIKTDYLANMHRVPCHGPVCGI